MRDRLVTDPVGLKKLRDILTKDYVPLRDHGVLFNNRTAVLISSRGEVDWGCFPNFDSEPVFFSLLDHNIGGRFYIRPKDKGLSVHQHYHGNTSTLVTEFTNKDGSVMTITDFLPISGEPEIYFSEIHRIVRAHSEVTAELAFEPFGRATSKHIRYDPGNGYVIRCKDRAEYLATDLKLDVNKYWLGGEFKMSLGEERTIVASYGIRTPYGLKAFHTKERFNETQEFWDSWSSKLKYKGMYTDTVKRSAITLKGMFFEPTGFMCAAPTAGLPEAIGGIRNWDYRFAWVRDTAYVIDVMVSLGYRAEASRFLYSIIDRIEHEGRIRTLYTISRRDRQRETDQKFDGYMDSKPVRFGNAAAKQFQIDQYAALVNAVYIFMKNGGIVNLHMWRILRKVTTKIMKFWYLPDNSIWEIRGRQRHYIYSKALAWKALKDTEEIAKSIGVVDDLISVIRTTRADIKRSIELHGVSGPEQGFYAQYYGGTSIDASLLRLPLIGYCKADSPTFRETLRQIESRLMKEDFLFLRYDIDDGMGEDNAFLLLTFWYIQDLILLGDTKRAHKGLAKLMSMMNGTGLLSEEIGFGTHEFLGNYPQALSHLSLISTIMKYEKARKGSEHKSKKPSKTGTSTNVH